MKALGIDLSEWDLRPIDYRQASKLLSFGYIKISQGVDPDPLFPGQWRAAVGWILRGLYHFFDPRVDPGRSVDKTLELYRAETPGELPPALDLESNYGVSYPETLEKARAWLEIWEDKTGIRPIIYSSPGFLGSLGAGLRENQWLRGYPVWLSQWYFDNMPDADRKIRIGQILRGEMIPNYPAPVSPWSLRPPFWQWTSRGEPGDIPGYYMGPGHKLAVDLNYYDGTEEDLFRQYGTPRRRLENGESMYLYSITPTSADGLKVRKDHYRIESPIPNRIGSLSVGRFAFGNEKWEAPADGTNYKRGDTWLHALSVDGVALEGWIAEIHNGARVGRIDVIGDEDPETPPQEEGAAVSINVSMNPIIPGEDVTGEISISSPGHVSQNIPLRLPPA
jgi:GH25 family lysozyme M1 (1,4-beta-N-acetylmuramidase)